MNVDRVFHRQRMQMKQRRELLERRRAAESVDIDPRNAAPSQFSFDFGNVRYFAARQSIQRRNA